MKDLIGGLPAKGIANGKIDFSLDVTEKGEAISFIQ